MSESFVRLPDDTTAVGKRVRNQANLIGGVEVHQQVTTLALPDGTLIDVAAGLPARIADGADVALGTTTDDTTANTAIGRLKRIVAQLDGTIATSAVDGSINTIGARTDADWATAGPGSLISIAKRISRGIGGISQKINEGKGFFTGTGRVTLTAAGNFRVTMENPAGSGKTVYIYAIVGINGAGSMAWADIRMNPTTGLPAEVATPRNNILGGGLAPVHLAKHDTNLTTPIGGGTLINSIGIPAGSRTVVSGSLFVLPQGVMMSFNVAFAGAADTDVTVYLYEE